MISNVTQFVANAAVCAYLLLKGQRMAVTRTEFIVLQKAA